MSEDFGQRACEKRHYEVTEDDLPLSCPPKGQRVWDAHPRVYLPIKQEGKVICPYCSTQFVLSKKVKTA